MTLCSWPEPPHHPPTHYVATYRLLSLSVAKELINMCVNVFASERHRQSVTKHCHLIQPGSSSSDLISASSSDQLWHCHMPSLKLLTDYINVTAVYSGRSSFHLSSFMLEDIVKPDPPVDITVSPHDSKRLLVQWSPPPTWAHLDIFPLKYQIKYQRESRGIPQSYNVRKTIISSNSRSLGPIESNRVVLKLKPGAYLFQVCAKELLNLGECSDWSSPVKITIPRTR
ncbi:hypothetical protein F7725_008216 [Dissostichus mawsoni]|uniref:Fibronectin type-III domain-containing protein n=1 Tax=Dissostichus mawsoni TaxID=36200 RepID=A0A7J5Y7E2_DISMA|nr:hypothetical protein F7725_008216 [Dissostichus mawsoni]